MKLSFDWETRSACDLPARGAWTYARDPTTDIVVGAWAFEGEEPVSWLPGEPCPDRVREHIENGGTLRAWNVMFEFEIWNEIAHRRYGWPVLNIEQVECVMAEAYAMGFPGKLEKAAVALGLEERKDIKGQRVMLQISQPRKIAEDGTITWWDSPEKFEIVRQYNLQDVRTEMGAGQRLMRLSDAERKLWLLDAKINARGVRVDIPSIVAGIDLVTSEKQRLDDQMRSVTGNVVAGCTDVRQLTKWLVYRGVKCESVAVAAVVKMLAGELPADCRRALQLRQEAAKSSTAKLPAMRDRACYDDRMRGILQFHGANTGRWAARGPQLQNVPRPMILHGIDDVEDAISHFGNARYLDVMYGDPMTIVSDCLRSLIVAAPGKELVCCDYSNIEGRVLPWLAGEEWKLDAFREYDAGTGPDLYLVAVARGRNITIEASKPFRQEGKVEELAFQFGGGVGAMTTWCTKFGMVMSEEEKESRKKRWRKAHPKVVKFWYALEEAAIHALKHPGVAKARGISFVKRGSFLFCRLPSGRVLVYPYPQLGENKWGGECITYMYEGANTRQWVRGQTYGGSLAENVTQAVARDILVHGMWAVEAEGYPVVMHVHDEIVAEVPTDAKCVDEMSTLMSNSPHWAIGLPIAATGFSGTRYRKD